MACSQEALAPHPGLGRRRLRRRHALRPPRRGRHRSAFVTATVAALAGVAEHESGLASGLSNTAFQIGAALGVAIVTTVAVTRSEDYLAANDGANRSSC